MKKRTSAIALCLIVFSFFLSGCTNLEMEKNVLKSQTGEKEMNEAREYGEIEAMPLVYLPGERGEILFRYHGEKEVLACLIGKNYAGKNENEEYWKTTEEQCQKTKHGEIVWNLIAPSSAPKGKYAFVVRYYANFTSSANVLIPVITPSAKSSGKYEKSKVTYENAKVSISVSLPDYLLLKENRAKGEITLRFHGESTRIFDYRRFSLESKKPIEISERDMQKLLFSIRAPESVKITCDAEKEGEMYVAEFFGKDAYIYCSVEIEAKDVISEKVYPVTINAYYAYYEETSPVILELSEE